jgi:TetR/AcrR family transcriptional regulator, repressor for neighboring sulfatase
MSQAGLVEKPTGRSAVMDAIIDAAVELYAGRNPDEVTVRDIAERAGVSHALVHHYFGTKGEVLRAVLERNAQRLHSKVDWTAPAEHVAVQVFRSSLDNPDYARAVLRKSVDGTQPEWLQRGFPPMERLVDLISTRRDGELSELEHCDPQVAAMVIVAFNFGWIATEGWLLKAVGLEGRDIGEIHSQIECVLRSIVRMVEAQ